MIQREAQLVDNRPLQEMMSEVTAKANAAGDTVEMATITALAAQARRSFGYLTAELIKVRSTRLQTGSDMKQRAAELKDGKLPQEMMSEATVTAIAPSPTHRRQPDRGAHRGLLHAPDGRERQHATGGGADGLQAPAGDHVGCRGHG